MVKQVAVGEDQVILGKNGSLVSSKSQPGGWHIVKDGACDCKGFEYRGKCRHLAAVEQATAERKARQAEALRLMNQLCDEQNGYAAVA